MAYENLIAEVLGGTLSGIRYIKSGWITVLQIAVTGMSLAHFVGADVARIVLYYTNISFSYGAVLFLVSYLGPTALERVNLFMKAFQVSKLWNQKK